MYDHPYVLHELKHGKTKIDTRYSNRLARKEFESSAGISVVFYRSGMG